MTETSRELTLEQINDYRRRVLNGESVPREELAAALRALRAHRGNALRNTKKAKTRELESKSLDELLGI